MNRLDMAPHIAVLAAAVIFSSATISVAQAEEKCPPEWDSYIDKIREATSGHRLSMSFIFVDRSGNAYDCRHDVDVASFIKAVSDLERSLPLDRTAPLTVDPGDWPTNICATADANFPELKYFLISLPRDASILALPVCEARVQKGDGRIMVEINGKMEPEEYEYGSPV